jgi:hypothetical protein
MPKIRYEIDPHNRLVIRKTGERTKLTRFRTVCDGRFKIGKNNSLTYHIKTPGRDNPGIPHQVKFKGNWALDKNHDLRFTLDKWKRQTFGDRLTIKGSIIDVDKNSLLFAVTTGTKQNTDSLYVLKLQGSWRLDKFNRLNFKVKKGGFRYDTLILSGRWEINKNHRIIYQYEKARLIRKSKKIHALIFKGYWDIKDKARISYVLDKKTRSQFDFKTGLGVFKDKYIKYEFGIGIPLILSGTWRIKKDRGLTFEIDCGNKKVRSISFGADGRLTGRDSISFRLKHAVNRKDMDINLKLSRKMLKGDGEAFLSLLKSKKESGVFVGVGKRW